MKYRVFSENTWVYPDTVISDDVCDLPIKLHVARGSDVCFQLLTDLHLAGDEPFSFSSDLPESTAVVYQLLKARVGRNSGAKTYTTDRYEDAMHFVTRKAPFEVYDVTKPLCDNKLSAGRGAFYIRLDVAIDAIPGAYEGCVSLQIGRENLTIPLTLKVYNAQVPPLEKSAFHMINWIYFDRLAEQHGVEAYGDEYLHILKEYLKNQLDMRNDYLMIPSGEPVRDGDGKVVDFDFSKAALIGNLALSMGFKYVLGGFVARFEKWDEPEQYLLWDREVGCTTVEGFRQLKIYFKRAYECVLKNGWEEHYMQCLVDEPQFANSLSYRALSGICRQNMKGVIINDPVETTDIEGAVDVWVVKQAVYEKHLETFRKLQSMGEEMWIYTCGFPAGGTMNRIADLPLTASRLPMWLCCKYHCPGFLHWGYHAHDLGAEDLCTPTGRNFYPPGNASVIYRGDGRPWYSVRGHLQRAGAADYELLYQLSQKDRAKAEEIIEKCCRSFDDYERSGEVIDAARVELLEALD